MSDYTWVTPTIAIGGWSAARDHGYQFNVIINVATDAPNFGEHHFHLVDGPGNTREEMRAAIECVKTALKSGQTTLVHCVAGRSRSITVVAAAVSEFHGSEIEPILRNLKRVRNCEGPNHPHPALLELI